VLVRSEVRVGGAAGVLLAATLCLASCAGPDAASAPSGRPSRTPSAGPMSHEYLPGLRAFPHLPEGATHAPVVVMIPGGGWQSADPTVLEPLADALADHGVVAVPVVIRAAEDGVVHPVPVQDVLCALADGAATATAAGIRPTRLVLLGHSSGAHLSALATLTPQAFHPRCQDPLVEPDALVGLAGPYDIRNFSDAADRLFAPDADQATRDAANPVLLAAQRPQVPVLLMHGKQDELVAPQFSEDFASALRTGGHATTLELLPGVDHGEVYWPQVAAGPVTRWLDALPTDPP
jgi:acetyl esterase/lipase